MKSQMLIFSLVMTGSLFVLWLVICWRMIAPLKTGRPVKFLLGLSLLTALILYYVTRVFVSEGLPQEMHTILRWIGYLSLGFISLTIPFLLVKELVLGANSLRRKVTGEKIDGNRRAFLQNAGNAAVLATVLPTMAFSIDEAYQTPVVKKVSLPVRNLHSDLEGLTIAQISDLHVGSILDAKWLTSLVKQVEALQPDVFVVTGDAIDGKVTRVGKELEILKDYNPPYGKFFVTGNHEFYSGVDGWVEKMRELGFTVLNNEHSIVKKGNGKLLMAGVWDYFGERFGERYISDPIAARMNAPAHDASLLLAHQPKSVFAASEAGYDIQLSGHTHGGQYFPWTYAIHLFQPYVAGIHKVKDTTLYINTGTGFWGPPMRLTVPPEISLHTLTTT